MNLLVYTEEIDVLVGLRRVFANLHKFPHIAKKQERTAFHILSV